MGLEQFNMGVNVVFMCVIALLGLFDLSSANVDLKGVWKPNFGWEITCSWTLSMNDSLMLVRLHKNGRQYMIFRPRLQLYEPMQMQARIEESSSEFDLKVNCILTTPQGQSGRCVTSVELHLPPPTPDVYRCEISGEAPKFLEEAADYSATVSPGRPEISRVPKLGSGEPSNVLNCTASGIPPPKLIWSSVEGGKIPRDFANTTWNPITKLWHSWSTLNPQEDVLVTCSSIMGNGKNLETSLDVSNSAAYLVPPILIIIGILLLSSCLR